MTSKEREKRNDARRLACALAARANDAGFMTWLARNLHYMPQQLAQDVRSLDEYTAEKVREDFDAEN